jgi:AcrR family transcriptional regulator
VARVTTRKPLALASHAAATADAPPRSTYRHGNLRQALVDAGYALAREAGPEAVSLREATRRAGVSPNAAYRHFDSRDALFEEVRAAALAAMAAAMEKRLRTLGAPDGSLRHAQASLRAVGTAYLQFAREERGLFRTGFAVAFDESGAAAARKAGPGGLGPFELLGRALDQLAEARGVPLAVRGQAEYLAWSAVHGLAMLALDGPLKRLGPRPYAALGQQLLDMVEDGILRRPPADAPIPP